MDAFRYLYNKVLAVIFRFMTGLKFKISADPDAVLMLPSRDPKRKIKAHIYNPKNPEPWPDCALINLHGSGFILPLHGNDDTFCRQMSIVSNYTVFDIQYRLAPEHPFPAALEDIEDVVHYIQSQPESFNPKEIAISGFSAGGTLALSAASSFLPYGTFSSVLAFYPVTDFHSDYGLRQPPDFRGMSAPPFLRNLFRDCYVPRGVSLQDPRVSPLFAKPGAFPKHMLVVTAALDGWALEAEELAEMVKKDRGPINVLERNQGSVICKRMADCTHGWDKGDDGTGPKDRVQIEARDEAYRLADVVLCSN